MSRAYYITEARDLRSQIRRGRLDIAKYNRFIGDVSSGIFFQMYHDSINNEHARGIFARGREQQMRFFQRMTTIGPTSRMATSEEDGVTNPCVWVLMVHTNISRSRSIQTMTQWYKQYFWILNGNAALPNRKNHEKMKAFLTKYVSEINRVYANESTPSFVITEHPCETPCADTLDMGGNWTFYLEPLQRQVSITSLHRFV